MDEEQYQGEPGSDAEARRVDPLDDDPVIFDDGGSVIIRMTRPLGGSGRGSVTLPPLDTPSHHGAMP